MRPPPVVGPVPDFIENPPNFQGRPCVPPPSSRAACATPRCPQRVDEPGDTFCARCVADYEAAESHEVGCPCGPCGVHSVRSEEHTSELQSH